jgi:hypothetical protein
VTVTPSKEALVEVAWLAPAATVVAVGLGAGETVIFLKMTAMTARLRCKSFRNGSQ